MAIDGYIQDVLRMKRQRNVEERDNTMEEDDQLDHLIGGSA